MWKSHTVDSYSPCSYRSRVSLCDSNQLVQVQCYAKVVLLSSLVSLLHCAMHTYSGRNARKQRPVRLIANCAALRVRKRISVSDFLFAWSCSSTGL